MVVFGAMVVFGSVVSACGWSIRQAQRRWMQPADGGVVVLVWSVLTLAVLTATGQVLGALGLLEGWWVLAVAAIVAVVGGAIRFTSSTDADPGAGRREPGASSLGARAEFGVLVATVGAVAAQWGAHLGDAYARGMVQADNLWYHGPFVARLATTGDLGSLAPFGYPESRYFPLNTHVLGAMLTFPTGTDVLVPFVNHLLAALALLAAWVFGRRFGVGAPAVMVTVAVFSLPLIASTQAGQMYNDVAALALVVAAVALHAAMADSGEDSPDALVVVAAFVALGWALSTKLTVVVPVAVIAVAMVVGLVRAGERRLAAVGSGCLVVTGGVWFVRNLLVSGSPMPYADLRIGGVGFDRQVPSTGSTLAATVDDLSEFGRYYLDSLDVSFGPLWFVVVAGAVGGSVAGVILLHGAMRTASLAGAAGLVSFPFMPLTGELPFVNNLRYSATAVTLGLLALAGLAASRQWLRWAVISGAVIVVGVDLASPHRARVPAWPDESWWAIGGSLVAGAVLTAPWWWRRVSDASGSTARLVGAAGAVCGVVALAVAVPALDDRYLEGRYMGDDLPDAALYFAARADDPIRVDVFGSVETYPFFGERFEHQVAVWNERLDEIPAGPQGCAVVRSWMQEPFGDEIESGRIAVGEAWLMRTISADERAVWFADDPSTALLFDDGREAAYERTGPLDPEACPGN